MPGAIQAAAPWWADIASGVLTIVQVVAILVGGAWAYFKFLKGRTFANRLELAVTGTQVEDQEYAGIVVATSVKNDGLSQVRFLDDLKVVSVFGLRASQWIPGMDQDWGKQLMIFTVLDGHEWIEAQETITDQVLVAVPDDSDRTDPWMAFRLVLRVASEGRGGKRLKWTASAVVPAALRSADQATKGALR
jgi:hypothetical protein